MEADLEWLEGAGCRVLILNSPEYPPLLAEIPDPPPLLFVRGDPEVLAQPQLAVVGSRHPTPGGAGNAFEFARYLAARGLVITSGLAAGIDSRAHEGALAAAGLSVAVAGTGVDRVYPAGNRKLATELTLEGAVISEFPLGTGPARGNFPRRNRIISGLSMGVLVVEAARNSGSLITARLASEQGREVFAIPGSIHNPLARGCHALLREGAKLVETAADILEEIGPNLLYLGRENHDQTPADASRPEEEVDDDYRTILESMGYDHVSVDLLVERTGLTAEAVSSMLLLLELKGWVAPVAGGLYTRLNREAAK